MEEVAEILLKLKAVLLSPDKPFTFTSGIISPIYVDNRIIISFPKERKRILNFFCKIIENNKIKFDIIGGVATAGIPWASWLSEKFNRSMIYIRGNAKAHGRQNRLEGVIRKGQRVIVIEDHISTGKSSIAAIKAIRDAGAIIDYCLSITTYDFEETLNLFESNACKLVPLIDFSTLIQKAVELKYINYKEMKKIMDWNSNPSSYYTS